NPGGVRTDIVRRDDGNVTYADVFAAQPFNNSLVTLTLTGAQIKELLERQWLGPQKPRILQGAGDFSYTWGAARPGGGRRAPARRPRRSGRNPARRGADRSRRALPRDGQQFPRRGRRRLRRAARGHRTQHRQQRSRRPGRLVRADEPDLARPGRPHPAGELI